MEEVKVYTEEEKKLQALRGFFGILPDQVRFVSPPQFKEAYPDQPDKWPRFKIKAPTGLDWNDVLDTTGYKDGAYLPNSGAIRTLLISKNLLDWSGYSDGSKPIQCPKLEGKIDTLSALKILSPSMQEWLKTEISRFAELDQLESDALKF